DALNHPNVSVEHLLLGILDEEQSGASKVLRAYGLSASAVRQHISEDSPQQRFSVFWLPKAGCVPRSGTAVRIAESVWAAIYGNETVAREQGFRADLLDDIWTVRGCQHDPTERSLIAQIEKNDGRILKLGEEWPE